MTMPRIPTKTRIHPAFLRCDLDQPTCTESQVRDFPIKAVPVVQHQADKCHRSAGTMQGFFLYVSDVDPDQSDGRAPPECPRTPSPVSRSLAGHYRSWIDGRVTTSDTRARSSPRGGVIRLPAV